MNVLISHVQEDYASASHLADYLSEQSWTVWWNGSLPTHLPLDIATERILNSARLVITIWSVHSIESRLIRNTALEAIENCRWLPVRIDEVKLPLRLRGYSPFDLFSRPLSDALDQSDSLLEFCRVLIGETQAAASAISMFVDSNPTNSNEASKQQQETSKEAPVIAQAALQNDRTESSEYARFRLGDWLVDEGRNRIRRQQVVRRITPRSMQVLMYLIENKQQPVSIGQLLSHIWHNRVVVESVVHRCINELRGAFEDDFRQPRYIETIAKKGYQIVAEVTADKPPTN